MKQFYDPMIQMIFKMFYFHSLLQEAFFGKNLLDTVSKKKVRRNEGDTPSTPSEDGEKPTQVTFGDDAFQGSALITDESLPQHEQVPFSQACEHPQESQKQYPNNNSGQAASKQFAARSYPGGTGQHHSSMGLDNHDRFVL